jgi:hypothetical protein
MSYDESRNAWIAASLGNEDFPADGDTTEWYGKVERAVDIDDVEFLNVLLIATGRGSVEVFPDVLYSQLWRRVCRGESSSDPLDVIAANFFDRSKLWEDQLYLFCAPECTLMPSRELLDALLPDEEEVSAFIARLVDSDVRPEFYVSALENIDLLESGRGRHAALVLAGLMKSPEILDNTPLLTHIVHYFGCVARLLWLMDCAVSQVLECIRGAKDSFECFHIFERFIALFSPKNKLKVLPLSLFSIAILHCAIAHGWEIGSSSLEFVGRCDDQDSAPHGFCLPMCKEEYLLAHDSLKVVLNSPKSTPSYKIEDIGIGHPNWARSRFLQECIVRVGLAGEVLFAVDSAIVAKWIRDNGNVVDAVDRFRKTRGAEFKEEEVHPCIAGVLENIHRIMKKPRIS